MSEYKVLITETWKRAVTVDAESREEAEAAVRCQYKNGEYALVSADSDGVSFSAQYPEQQVELSYGKLRELFRKAERGGIHVSGYITFRADSFSTAYSERSRTYAVSSDNKAFQPNMGGYSIYARCLDGTDPCVRLEQYMAAEYGGERGWSVERCYMEMLRAGEVREDDDSYLSPLDVLFERLEMRDSEHIAVKYYKQYRSGSAKTLKSIQITLASHMEKFNLDSLIALTATDELHLQDMGEKRVALFALIPDSDTSFNFLVSILYQQLFQQLFDSADHKHGGSLPVPVHFLMDEFANISLPNDFEIKLSTMRSRNVFVSIILQNIAQLKALFEKQWESVLGNCDELLYLGGNEQGSHKYISELLGKATIDTNTYGKSSGRNGNYSTNYQITGRELMTPDEVRMLDNRKALLFIRGELPVCDDKFDIPTHPLVSRTPDGGGLPYVHGGTEQAVASIRVDGWQWGPDEEIPAADLSEQKFELLSSEELEAIFMEGNYDEAS